MTRTGEVLEIWMMCDLGDIEEGNDFLEENQEVDNAVPDHSDASDEFHDAEEN